MKSTIATSLFVLSMLMLGGCSTMHDQLAADHAQGHTQRVEDQEYIARVEQNARSHGVLVEWVNPPEKRVANQL